MPSWEAPSTFFPYLSSSYYNFNAITYFNVKNDSYVLRNADCIARRHHSRCCLSTCIYSVFGHMWSSSITLHCICRGRHRLASNMSLIADATLEARPRYIVYVKSAIKSRRRPWNGGHTLSSSCWVGEDLYFLRANVKGLRLVPKMSKATPRSITRPLMASESVLNI